MPRALLFDLDGTLVESLPGIASALNRALTTEHLPTHDESAVRHFIGDGSWMLCRRAAPQDPDSRIDTLNQHFLREYPSTWRSGTELFPGILPLLETLAAKHIPLTVLSNKPHAFTVEIVAALFPTIPFTAVLGLQAHACAKPAPEGALSIAAQLQVPPSEILFVGDSTVDFDTATNAGMSPLLVDWGYHDRAALELTGAPVISSPDQLLPFLAAPHPEV